MITTIERAVERVYGVNTIHLPIPDRVIQLYRRKQINLKQRDAALDFFEMWSKPLTNTLDYAKWARKQDSTLILCSNQKPSRMKIVIDLIVLGRSISQIENSLGMSNNTALTHLKISLDQFPVRAI